MVKSLIGKADATLVNAAFAEAKSQVPADMSGIMATMTETQKQLDKQFVDMTTQLFGDINSANEEMQELVDPIYKSLQNGTFTDADVLSFKPVVDGFKDEWKLIPKGKEGDEARLLWKNKVNKFKNTIASFDQKLLELTTNVAGENYLPAGLQGIGGRDADKNLKFLSSIYRLKSGKEGNKATMTVDEKGEVFFSANIDGEEIKMSMQQIEDLMPTKDMNLVKNVDALLMNYKKTGATKGSIYDAAGLSDKVFNLLNTAKVPRNAFQTLAHYDYGRGSFFQDLYSPSGPMGKTISEAIKGLQYSADVKDKFDTDGVPGISAGDFTNENRKAIADYIMSNDKIGRRVLSNWFAATEGQSAFNDGRNLIPKTDPKNIDKDGKDKETGVHLLNQGARLFGPNSEWIQANILNSLGKKINKRQTIPLKGGENMVWDEIKGTYIILDKNKKPTGEITSKNELFTTFFGAERGATGVGIDNDFLNSDFYSSITDWTYKSKQQETQQDIAFNVIGIDGTTKLRNNIFDKNEGAAAIELRNILGGDYRVEPRLGGRDVLRIRTKEGDPIDIVEVVKNESGQYVPAIDSNGNYIYKSRIQTDFRESALDRKTKEMMSFYYTFADKKSKHYDQNIFSLPDLP